jgi:signal transduction histidine kinase
MRTTRPIPPDVRRTSLSSKLLLAALPLVAATGALLTVTVLTDLDRVDEAERDATLGTTWGVLLDASQAVTSEQHVAIDAMLGTTALNIESAAGTPDADALDAASADTNAAVATLLGALGGQAGFADYRLDQLNGPLEFARQLSRSWAHDPAVAAMSANSPFDQYETVLRELHTIGSLLQSATGDADAGRHLLGVGQLSDANLAAGLFTAALASYQLDPADNQHLIDARAALNDVSNAYAQFDTTANPTWAAAYRQTGARSLMSNPQSRVNRALNGDADAIDGAADAANTYQAIAAGDQIQRGLLAEVVANADAKADDISTTTRIRLAVIAGAVLVATVLAWLITRSITRRVRAVARNATTVATEQLPALVHALRDPRGRALPEVAEVSTKGGDELAELATSFNSLQRTLHEVAREQMTVLRRGVSDIFVTMARRNRSLVDRQLALLDEFEAEVDDPDVLASFYSLDHLATRMRRNSESLLVLANAEPRRGRVGPTEVDTVIRAAIGEIEDYRRVAIERVESLRVRGNVVADIAHLLAELLDNATAFSPPETVVRVGGRRVDGGFLVRIADSGVGIGDHRLEELNELLRNPPIVGLSVEPTLGISVVSLLAHKHDIEVTLTPSNPGLIVEVLLPSRVFADDDVPALGAPAGTPVRLDAAGLDTGFATALGLPAAVNGSPYSAADTHDDAEVLAALEAHFAAEQATDVPADRSTDDPADHPADHAADHAPAASPIPSAIDPGLTARLTDAFQRSDLASTSGDTPVRAPGDDLVDDLPVRSGGVGAATAFQSFRAGAEAASRELAGRPDAPPPTDPESAPHVVAPSLPAPPPAAFPAPAVAALPTPSLSSPAWATPPAPPAAAPAVGEPHRPPAPPLLPLGPSAQPVTPAHAQPAPTRATPDLPTRNRAAAAAASTAAAAPLEPDPADENAALAAALAAFDQQSLELPTRNPDDRRYTAGYGDDPTGESPVSVASPLGADQLRARLRAFQSEFRTGQSATRTDANPSSAHGPSAPGDDHA